MGQRFARPNLVAGLAGLLAAGSIIAGGSNVTNAADQAAGVSIVGRGSQSAGTAQPRYTVLRPQQPVTLSTTTTTVPYFTNSFTYQGTTYTYHMVGADPSKSSANTTIPTSITPLKIVWDGLYSYPTGSINQTATSALFKSATFTSGTTQYGDAIQRAEFWKYTSPTGAHSGYHTLLGTPTTGSLLTLNVPLADGTDLCFTSGECAIAVDINWFDAQLQKLVANHPATSLPLFLTYDIVLYENGNPNDCCVLGYHSAMGSTTVHTYAYASWLDNTLLGANVGNTASMSHEVAEWYNDPFTNNIVPKWTTGNSYGCSDLLEVGDPLAGTTFNVTPTSGGTALKFQDEAFLSWFSRQSPSIGISGYYSYKGNFKTYSKSC